MPRRKCEVKVKQRSIGDGMSFIKEDCGSVSAAKIYLTSTRPQSLVSLRPCFLSFLSFGQRHGGLLRKFVLDSSRWEFLDDPSLKLLRQSLYSFYHRQSTKPNTYPHIVNRHLQHAWRRDRSAQSTASAFPY